jgi:Kef-type K+ transport system membrane component KefB/predicted transcriptional regulator
MTTYSIHHLNLLFLLGIAVFGGTIGAKIFQKLRIPQVVGYIIIGLIIGESGLKVVSKDVINLLEPLNYFALGIIGFMIGGELRRDIFKKYGKQLTVTMFAEGIGAFLLVGIGAAVLVYLFTHEIKLAIALGVVLGAISSATDPASTIQVLWEYKTRGPLTTAAVAITALDDALALSLYGIGTSLAGALTGHTGAHLAPALLTSFSELFVALLIGLVSGLILNSILTRISNVENVLTFAIGSVLLVLGLATTLKLDIIMASMALGATLVNSAPRQSQKTFEMVKKFAPPIYILFFVFVGAGLKISSLSVLTFSLVAAYVLGRSFGKMTGVYLAAGWLKSPVTVKKYLGMCLFAQAGVAIGLSIMAGHRFDARTSSIVVLVVASTTFIVQVFGPFFVRMGAKKAGEVGLDITEEDLIETYGVSDVMDKQVPAVATGTSLSEVVDIVSSTDQSYYPVVDNSNKLVGAITLDGIRNTFKTQEVNSWLVALDIMEPVVTHITPKIRLSDALDMARRLDVEFIPVVDSDENRTLIGVLNRRHVQRQLSAEVLERQRKAESIY